MKTTSSITFVFLAMCLTFPPSIIWIKSRQRWRPMAASGLRWAR